MWLNASRRRAARRQLAGRRDAESYVITLSTASNNGSSEKGVPFAGSTDVSPPPAMIREWLILGPRGSGKRALTRTCFCRCCTLSAS